MIKIKNNTDKYFKCLALSNIILIFVVPNNFINN
nr:MAG TPA: hypothetical protein [Caudoviricetes sp.]